MFDSDNSDTSSSDIDISAFLKSDQNSSPKHLISDTDAKLDGHGQGPSATGVGVLRIRYHKVISLGLKSKTLVLARSGT